MFPTCIFCSLVGGGGGDRSVGGGGGGGAGALSFICATFYIATRLQIVAYTCVMNSATCNLVTPPKFP